MSNFPDLLTAFEEAVEALKVKLSQDESSSIYYNGELIQSIAKDIVDRWAVIAALVQGRAAYSTKADLPSSPPDGVVLAEVWNDAVELNNGLYGWIDGQWTKSTYDTAVTLKFLVGDVNGRVNTITSEKGLEQAETSDKALVISDEAGNVLINFDKLGNIETPKFDIETETENASGESPAFTVVDDSYRSLFFFDEKGALHLSQGEVVEGIALANDTVFALVDNGLNPCIEVKADGSVYIPKLIDDIEPPKPDLPISRLQWDINHIIVTGQSLSMGADSKPAVSLTQPYSNLTFDNGVRSGPTDESVNRAVRSPNITQFVPLVEEDYSMGGETITSGAANYCAQLLTADNNLYSKKILGTCVGYSGASIERISKGGNTNSYPDSLVHIEKGLDFSKAQNDQYGVSAILFMQGESNQRHDSVKEYYDKLSRFIDDYQEDAVKITGQKEIPPLITYQTVGRVVDNDDRIRYSVPQAQWLLSKNRHDVFVAAPVYPCAHIGTGLHLYAYSTRWLGHYFGKALHSINETGSWRPLEPVNMQHQGKVILVKFHVPYPPLVFNTSRVPKQDNYGFYVWEGEDNWIGERVPINSVEIFDKDTIKITLDREPIAPPTVLYAMDHDKDPTFVGARGNLCDSDPSESDLTDGNGDKYTLENWCVNFVFTENMNNGTYFES